LDMGLSGPTAGLDVVEKRKGLYWRQPVPGGPAGGPGTILGDILWKRKPNNDHCSVTVCCSVESLDTVTQTGNYRHL
jgi:hypothetical protein